MSSARKSPSTERAPIKPQPLDIPWSPVPNSVTVTAGDAEQASVLWDAFMPAYEDLLDATPVTGD